MELVRNNMGVANDVDNDDDDDDESELRSASWYTLWWKTDVIKMV